MSETNTKLTAAVEAYFADLGRVHASGGARPGGPARLLRPLQSLPQTTRGGGRSGQPLLGPLPPGAGDQHECCWARTPRVLETFRLAGSAQAFERRLEKPRAFARNLGAGLGEYLARALSHRAALAEPKDLAWLLASYARDGLARVQIPLCASSWASGTPRPK